MQLSIKYRPLNFSSLFGQKVSKRILINSIIMDRIPKALLIDGIRGIGKTTIARLYAGAINCSNFQNDLCGSCESCRELANHSHLSIFEFDAASNNSVDDIRKLENLTTQKAPHPYTVIILDEAHMLTKQAQAAFLKMLESPKPNVIFILVTTDPEKLETTIRSRCLSMPLQPLSIQEVSDNLKSILVSEGISFDEYVINSLSNACGGSLRDAQQMLDRLITSSPDGTITDSLLSELPGFINISQYKELATALLSNDQKVAIEAVEHWYYGGTDIQLLFDVGIPNLLRDFHICISGAYSPEINYLSGLAHDALTANLCLTSNDIKRITETWEDTQQIMRNTSHPKTIFSLFFAKVLCQTI